MALDLQMEMRAILEQLSGTHRFRKAELPGYSKFFSRTSTFSKKNANIGVRFSVTFKVTLNRTTRVKALKNQGIPNPLSVR